MAINTINKNASNRSDFAMVSKKAPAVPAVRVGKSVKESDVLRWSREAKKLRRSGKLSRLA
jgi:hypothetical protein